jgi:hypothetical protein
MRHQDALAQLARETQRAKRRLALERGLRAGFFLIAAIGLWAFIALIGGHETLPLLLQSLTAIGALLVFAWLSVRAKRAWREPTEEEARARLAQDARLEAGAFEALRDQPTRYDAFSVALWQRERERAIERAQKARAGPTRVQLDERDPHKLRFVLLAALAIALAFANVNAPDRLARAFLPDPGPLLGDQEMAIEAWATPADYTHAGPVSLSEVIGERVQTPPSVEVTVRLTGPTGAPALVFNGGGEQLRQRFERAADGAWEARMQIPRGGQLKIVRFHTRAQWRLAPAPDAAPTADFVAPIASLPDEHVSISWRARDDFGVRRMALRVRPINPPEGLVRADPIDTELEVPAGDPAEAQTETTIDLADHPYAGMEVEARVVAFDALGQEGASAPMRFTLPEKVFLQPLAQAAIEIRRHLLAERRAYTQERRAERRTIPAGDIILGNQRIEIRDYDRRPSLQRAPEGIRRAARLIDALTMEAHDGYFRDLAVFLGFRSARAQLDVARDIDATEIAADTLWRTALRAEYGGAADARRALEEAQRQLAEALAQNAPQERIRQLMDALRRATDTYMQALVQEALRNGDRANMEDTEDQTNISGQDIQQMLEQVQRLSEQGRNEEANQLLQQLANILANMEVQLEQAQGEGGEQSDEQMQQSMDALSEQMGEQRALRDETRQEQQGQQQQGQGGSGGDQQGGQGGDDLAERQSEIRQGLAEAQRMAEESGAAPSNDLNAAGESMRQAEEALRRGDLEGAERAQSAALDNLREGAESLAAEMRERGQASGTQDQGGQGARDPLNRPVNGAGATDGEGEIPSQADPVRAREIFDEIRRRAQDPNRPEAEREYLRRLLDRFGDS